MEGLWMSGDVVRVIFILIENEIFLLKEYSLSYTSCNHYFDETNWIPTICLSNFVRAVPGIFCLGGKLCTPVQGGSPIYRQGF